MVDGTEFLSKPWIFSHLTDEQVGKIAVRCREKSFRRGQPLFYMGDPGGYLYVIREGSVKVIMDDEEGREIILNMLGSGEILGEMTLIDGGERSATVVAVEDTKTFMLARDDFLELLKEDSEIAERLLVLMSSRLRRADRLIWDLSFAEVEARLARMLLDMARKDGQRTGADLVLELHISRQELAAMIGASREATSRALRKLQQRRLLSVSGRTVTISRLLASIPVQPVT